MKNKFYLVLLSLILSYSAFSQTVRPINPLTNRTFSNVDLGAIYYRDSLNGGGIGGGCCLDTSFLYKQLELIDSLYIYSKTTSLLSNVTATSTFNSYSIDSIFFRNNTPVATGRFNYSVFAPFTVNPVNLSYKDFFSNSVPPITLGSTILDSSNYLVIDFISITHNLATDTIYAKSFDIMFFRKDTDSSPIFSKTVTNDNNSLEFGFWKNTFTSTSNAEFNLNTNIIVRNIKPTVTASPLTINCYWRLYRKNYY